MPAGPPQNTESAAGLPGCLLPVPPQPEAFSYKQTALDNLGNQDDGTSLWQQREGVSAHHG